MAYSGRRALVTPPLIAPRDAARGMRDEVVRLHVLIVEILREISWREIPCSGLDNWI